jgi:hypothetical protein
MLARLLEHLHRLRLRQQQLRPEESGRVEPSPLQTLECSQDTNVRSNEESRTGILLEQRLGLVDQQRNRLRT